jgi:hypothetical protein
VTLLQNRRNDRYCRLDRDHRLVLVDGEVRLDPHLLGEEVFEFLCRLLEFLDTEAWDQWVDLPQVDCTELEGDPEPEVLFDEEDPVLAERFDEEDFVQVDSEREALPDVEDFAQVDFERALLAKADFAQVDFASQAAAPEAVSEFARWLGCPWEDLIYDHRKYHRRSHQPTQHKHECLRLLPLTTRASVLRSFLCSFLRSALAENKKTKSVAPHF